MSQGLEKVRGLRHLPIFPLPLVLLPGEILPLHIFEEKYKQMLVDVSDERNLFGITLFEPTEAYIDRPTVGSIGCVAEIREAETLQDGRSNIVIMGVARYRLTDYVESGDPYLVGDLEFFADDDPAGDVAGLADEVFGLFDRIAKAAYRIGGSRGRSPELERTDPESLSFLVTAAFNFENDRKYHLLEMTSTHKRLVELKAVLDQAVLQMEESAQIQTASRLNGHSKKKLDV
jgi:Lon protease-like protein